MTSHAFPARAGPLNSIREVPGPALTTHPSVSPPPPDSTDTLASLSKTTSPVSPTLPIQRPSDDDLLTTRRISDPVRAHKTAPPTAAGRKGLTQESKPSRTSSIRKKHGSMFSFFSSKDPSTVSADESAANRRSSTTSKRNSGSTAKTPPSSFKLNSKWDGLPRQSKDTTKPAVDRRDSGWSSGRRWSSNPSSRNSLSASKTHISVEGGSPFASSNVLPDEDRRTEFPFDKRGPGVSNTTSSPSPARPSSNLIHSTSNPSQSASHRPVSPMSDRETALPIISHVKSQPPNDQIAPSVSPHKSVSPAQSFVSAHANTKSITTDSSNPNARSSPQPRSQMTHAIPLLHQDSSVSSLSPVAPSPSQDTQAETQHLPFIAKQRTTPPQQPIRPPRPFDDDDEELYAKPGHSPMRQDFAHRGSDITDKPAELLPDPRESPSKGEPPLQIDSSRRDSKRESKRLPSDHDDAKWVSGLDEVTVAASSLDTVQIGRRASLNGSPNETPALRFSQASSVAEQPPRQLHSAHSRTGSAQASPTVHLSPAPEQYRRSLHSERSRSRSGSRSRSNTPPHGSSLRAPDPHDQSGGHSRQISNTSMASYMNSSQMSDNPHQVAEASVVQMQPTSASPIEVQPGHRFESSTTRRSRQSLDTSTLQQPPRPSLLDAAKSHYQRQSLDVYRPQRPSSDRQAQPGRTRASSDEQRAGHARNFSKPFNLSKPFGVRASAAPAPMATHYIAEDAHVPRSKFARGRLAPKPVLAESAVEDHTPISARHTTGQYPAAHLVQGHQRMPSVEVTDTDHDVPTVNTSSSSLPNPPSASTTGGSYATAMQSATEHHTNEEESPSTRETSLDVPHPEQHDPKLHYRLSARDITIVNDELMGNRVTETSKNYAQSVGFWETAARSAEEAQKRQDTGMDCRLAGPFDPSSPVF
ncbi:hypothetical protein KVT40_003381 [Elsinoe batatas]|uniref:Uncharacterized protein n=1 Tax=Elsinoe batatas TaxID=2601811 RepID=A0A8K0L421_9PEZI|nr:hypothetical protein KVT40_003381 [Elsinoe batatas]